MFADLPRWFGNPSQIFVTSKFALDNFIKTFNGKLPCFISTYRFPTRQTPIVDMSVFDIDSKFNLRIPYRDTKKLKEFCDKTDIPYVIDFSGGKGFHFFLITKPEEGSEEVRDKLYSIQLGIVNHLGIQAIDLPTIGRLRWLIRIPGTKYIRFDKKGKKMNNDNYCRYIPAEDFEQGLHHILTLVKEPGVMPKRPKATFSMDEVIEKIPKFKMKHRFSGNDNLELMQSAGSVMTPSACAVGLPCLQEIAKQTHPNHFDRIELVAWLKVQNYRDIAICGFIKSLKWTDYNYKDTITNVASIKARFPKCSYLRDRYPEACKNCGLRR